ncbi:hypothetical protein PE066_08315 [Ramlibacter tataouinensis]|uniref:hypothetical protein n=1 Tax=Ramlibacter tataouinensis TaxID=94132 RepID=UPI0022F4024E|nr:hypothetical protein [Ramlibacter tataouinensis]WBY03523.1 hypothetical protein PE066_08315 [Ramlibacter tataouinensis]
MPFAVYMIGFLLFMAIVVWAAVVVGVAQLYITIAALVLLAIGVVVGLARSRSRPRRRGPY